MERAEYLALREEILKRIELRQQVVLAVVTIAGVLWGLGIQGKYYSVFFLVPPITTFLAISWAHHDVRIKEIGNYIKERFEKGHDSPFWEHYLAELPRPKVLGIPRRLFFSHMGIFLVIEVLSVALGLSSLAFYPGRFMNRLDGMLISIDVPSILMLGLAARRQRLSKNVEAEGSDEKDKESIPEDQLGERKITMKKEENPSEQSLIAFYQVQWADIHHNRNQDWELARLLILGILGAGGLKLFEFSGKVIDVRVLVVFYGGFSALSLIGLLVTARHRLLFKEKMEVVRDLERVLGIAQMGFFQGKNPGRGWHGRIVRKFPPLQYILMLLYFLLFVLFGMLLLLTLLS